MAETYNLKRVSDSAFIVNKDGKDEYNLLKVNGYWTCTCTGYYYRGTCKHIDMLKGRVSDSEIGSVDEIHTAGEIEKIKKSLYETVQDYDYTLSGDYRRGADIVTTLPIIVLADVKVFKEFATKLDGERFKATLSDDNVVRGYFDRVPVVFMRTDRNNFATTLLATTGGKDENTRLRNIAKIKGWRLVENGLFDGNGAQIQTETEREVYEKLGESYIEPKDRK